MLALTRTQVIGNLESNVLLGRVFITVNLQDIKG